LKTTEELTETERGLSDRFGALPESVKALTLLMKLKILGRAAGCAKIAIAKNGTLDLFIDGADKETAKERIKAIFESSEENYQFEVSYDEQIIRLRTELTSERVDDMAAETAEILDF